MSAGDDGNTTGWPGTLGWSAYLACSWTWCIGMFLPVLLVRDYGIWGFVVFAVPNVLGAGAMGWVLRHRGASEAIVERHWPAIAWFSRVTIAFQCVFLCWLIVSVVGPQSTGRSGYAYAAVFAPAVVAMFCMLWATSSGRSMRLVRTASIVLLLGSAMAAVVLLMDPEPASLYVPMAADMFGLAWFAPVCMFGFLACPYLDITLHRARQSAPGAGGTAAFTIGFGVLFLAMMLFTLGYASRVLESRPWFAFVLAGPAGVAILIHIMAQLSFTIGVHGRELKRLPDRAYARRATNTAIVAVSLVLVFTLEATHAGLSYGEILYRCFMSFYGLVFPAYVWLVMIPTGDGHSGLGGENGRRKLFIWAFTVGVAATMFWMGFIERSEVWLAPGLAIVLCARFVLPGRTRVRGG